MGYGDRITSCRVGRLAFAPSKSDNCNPFLHRLTAERFAGGTDHVGYRCERNEPAEICRLKVWLPTNGLQNRCSTTELSRHLTGGRFYLCLVLKAGNHPPVMRQF